MFSKQRRLQLRCSNQSGESFRSSIDFFIMVENDCIYQVEPIRLWSVRVMLLDQTLIFIVVSKNRRLVNRLTRFSITTTSSTCNLQLCSIWILIYLSYSFTNSVQFTCLITLMKNVKIGRHKDSRSLKEVYETFFYNFDVQDSITVGCYQPSNFDHELLI